MWWDSTVVVYSLDVGVLKKILFPILCWTLQGYYADGEFQGVVIRTVEHEFGGIFSSVNISLKKHFQIIKLILHINVNMMIY